MATVVSCNSEQLPNVTIETEKGNIIIELYPESASRDSSELCSVDYVRIYTMWCDVSSVCPGFCDPRRRPTRHRHRRPPDGQSRGEFQDPDLRDKMPPHDEGVIAMARTQDPDSAGSQFYICLTSDPRNVGHLNGNLHHIWESY